MPFKIKFFTLGFFLLLLWNGCLQKPVPSQEFCGQSTFGACTTNSDCQESGCSHQICQSRFEEPFHTTCEWRDCYNAPAYRLACQCFEDQCQWKKTI